MKAQKSKFRKLIGAVLLLAFVLNISVPAYAELSVAKNSEQLKYVFGDDFKICTAHGAETISYVDYYKLLHDTVATEKNLNSKDKLEKLFLLSANFVYSAKNSSAVLHGQNQPELAAQNSHNAQTSRAPPYKLI